LPRLRPVVLHLTIFNVFAATIGTFRFSVPARPVSRRELLGASAGGRYGRQINASLDRPLLCAIGGRSMKAGKPRSTSARTSFLMLSVADKRFAR